MSKYANTVLWRRTISFYARSGGSHAFFCVHARSCAHQQRAVCFAGELFRICETLSDRKKRDFVSYEDSLFRLKYGGTTNGGKPCSVPKGCMTIVVMRIKSSLALHFLVLQSTDTESYCNLTLGAHAQRGLLCASVCVCVCVCVCVSVCLSVCLLPL